MQEQRRKCNSSKNQGIYAPNIRPISNGVVQFGLSSGKWINHSHPKDLTIQRKFFSENYFHTHPKNLNFFELKMSLIFIWKKKR